MKAIDRIEHLCLVLLDLVMPGMNGWEFLKHMQARPGLAGVPIVVHSSATNAAPANVARVHQKPVDLERLLAVVREYCEA